MPSPRNSGTSSRIPPWLRVRLPASGDFSATRTMLAELGLNTVCQSARCPNVWECFSKKTATFLILGRHCTRSCAFCNIQDGPTSPPDEDEPRRVAEASARLGLTHVVVTSVTRDDLPDGGAGHFAATIRALRQALPQAGVEVLIPDFRGDESALDMVLAAGPDVLNHNVETAPGLYPAIRPQADYGQSLRLLRRAKELGAARTKSGLMLGLGESMEEARQVVADLSGAGCDVITVGQYMRPSRRHPEVVRYVPPEEFEDLAAYGRSLGPAMFSSPLVRSSYHAALWAGKDEATAPSASPSGSVR